MSTIIVARLDQGHITGGWYRTFRVKPFTVLRHLTAL